MERKTIKFEVKDVDEELGVIEGYGEITTLVTISWRKNLSGLTNHPSIT